MATQIELCPSFGPPSHRVSADAAVMRRAIAIPTALCIAMVIIGYLCGHLAGIDGTGLPARYIADATALTTISLLIYIFIQVSKLAIQRADEPLNVMWRDFRVRSPLLILPALVFPIFLAGYTTAKSSIHALVGFRWDRFWAGADALTLGNDAWRIAHSVFKPSDLAPWLWIYTPIWIISLGLFKVNVAIYADVRRVGVIYTAMFGTWLIGGWFLAYCFSASGPVFAHLFDPSLAERFEPLREALYNTNGSGRLQFTQEYLAVAVNSNVAFKGGGISAFPSMHLGAASIYVLASRQTPWFIPAIAFWALIFFLSAYFGYHYWVDGLAAALVAYLCWKVAEVLFRPQTQGSALLAV